MLKKVKHILNEYVFSKNQDETRVGFKIGNSNIMALEVLKRSNEFEIVSFEVIDKDSDSSDVVPLIKKIFTASRFDLENINTSISGSDVIIRFIKYPQMNPTEMKNSLQFEAEKYIPFNLDEVIIDYCLLSDDKEKGAKNCPLALVAAKKQKVIDLISNCKKAGFQLSSVDVDCFCSFNLLRFANPEALSENKLCAILNIGSEITNILIIHDEKPVFTRDLVFGGKDITKKISLKFDMPLAEAENFKKTLDSTITDNKVFLEEVLQYLVKEVKMSFNFYLSQAGVSEKISKVYLFGGTSLLEGLADVLSNTLEASVEVHDSLVGFKIGKKVDIDRLHRYRGSLSIPLGLAIRDI